jgi:hypothetical protein
VEEKGLGGRAGNRSSSGMGGFLLPWDLPPHVMSAQFASPQNNPLRESTDVVETRAFKSAIACALWRLCRVRR